MRKLAYSGILLFMVSTVAMAAMPDKSILADKQVLHRGNGSEPQSLDPHKSEGIPSYHVQIDLFEGLVGESPDGKLIPGAAEKWDISKDGTVYTFHIRKNAKWSNGDPLTADDFVFSWRRILDPNTGSHYSQTLAPMLNAEDIIQGKLPPEKLAVKAIDRHTLQVTLKGPTPYFVGLMTHHSTFPVHPPSVKKYGDKYSRPGNMVTNGPFKLAEWVVQSHIRVVRNTQYWNNDSTTLNEVNYYPIENESTEFKRYRAGELDMTETLSLAEYRYIKQNKMDAELHTPPYLGIYYYGFNVTQPPFKDNKTLRQALTMAIDRDILAEKVVGFGVIPAYGWVPPNVLNYEKNQEYDWKNLNRKERLDMAKKLYNEAGYSSSKPLEVEIRYNTQEGHKKLALAIASMWKQNLGIKVKILNEEWKVFLDTRKQKKFTQVFRAGWIGDYNDAFTFMELLHSQHGINDPGYNNPEYDRLLAESAVESDMNKRRELLKKAERIMLEDYPILPIYYYVTKRVVKPYVGGYVDNIMDHQYSKYFYIKKH